MNRVPMTLSGYESLTNELSELKSVTRPEIIEAIATARAHGDLSENAEYHAARERQSFVEGRILDLEDKLARAQVVDPAKLDGDTVTFGATVTIVEEEAGTSATYQIVGTDEADIDKGRLPISAPLSQSLIGKEVGDSIDVPTPQGDKAYELKKIEWI
ncbi:MAG: transcription elongation factor GreA [Pseudomonadota bacterium]